MIDPADQPVWSEHEFAIKDSGARQEFDGGMVRDTEDDKIDYTNLFELFEPLGTRYAEHMTKGRTKYPDPKPGVPNWTLAEPTWEMYHRFRRSAARHFKQWLRGDTDEDHASAVLFNMNGAEYVKQQIPTASPQSIISAKTIEQRRAMLGEPVCGDPSCPCVA